MAGSPVLRECSHKDRARSVCPRHPQRKKRCLGGGRCLNEEGMNVPVVERLNE